MIKITRNLLLLTLMFSQFAWADCGALRTDSYFNVVFEINNSELNETVTVEHIGGNFFLDLWSNNKDGFITPIIADSETKRGGNYHVWLQYEEKSNKKGDLSYYLYESGTSPVEWTPIIIKKEAELLAVKSVPIIVTGGNLDELSCSTDETVPELPEVPDPTSYDICEYVPDVVQSNKYYQGDVNGNLSISGNSYVSTIDPKHGYSLSSIFQSNKAGCQYNSNGTPGDKENCAVEPKANDFPSLVSFKTSENEFKCEAGKSCDISPGVFKTVIVENSGTLTLSHGEYWIKELKVGNSSQVKVSNSQQTIIHFQKTKLEENASINEAGTGNSENLLLIGYGSDGKLELEKNTRIYGYVYLDTQMGSLSLEKGDVVIVGGVTAPVISISAGAIIGTRSQCGGSTTKRYLVVEPTEKHALTCTNNAPSYTAKMMLDTTGDGSADTVDSSFNRPVTVEKQPGQSVCLQRVGSSNCLSFDSNNKLEENAINGVLELKVKPKGIGNVILKASTSESVENELPLTSTFNFMPYTFEVLPKSSVGKSDELIAGKPEDVFIGVLACTTPEDGAPEYIVDYQPSETKPIVVSTRNDAPSSGNSKVTISKSLKFINGKAELEEALSYSDAGKVTFTLKDPVYGKEEYCKGNSECESLFPSGSTGLEGSATLYVRPYTFALCDIKNPDDGTPRDTTKDKTDYSGTSESGPGFANSGEPFEVRLKPVIWLAGDSVSSDSSGDKKADDKAYGSNWCSKRKVTENYYVPSGSTVTIKAPVTLSIPSLPASPTSNDNSKLDGGELAGTVSYNFVNKVTNNGWQTSNLTWSEAGSLWLQADALYEIDGRSLPLDQSTVEIGRFYPNHLVIKESALVDAVDGVFTYMDQGFQMSFTVEARNKNNQPTQNYGLFNAGFQEELDLVAIDNQVDGVAMNDLTPRLDTALLPTPATEWAKNWEKATLTLSATAVGFKRDSTADGPYQVHLGLLTKARDNCSSNGCTDFSINDLEQRITDGATPVQATKLNGDIDARYGRMRMEDVTVPVTQNAEVPVIVEYYLSSNDEFIQNTDDSASLYGSNHGCSELIFPDAMMSALANTPISESVNTGEATLLINHPQGGEITDGYREQIRLGQRSSSAAPTCTSGSAATSNQSWLQYNWRDNGDEDPSAIVTFGVYRGNDRIIYRGEKGMNKLLN